MSLHVMAPPCQDSAMVIGGFPIFENHNYIASYDVYIQLANHDIVWQSQVENKHYSTLSEL